MLSFFFLLTFPTKTLLYVQNLNVLKAKQGIADHEFYHYDTPLTVKNETEALYEAGFSSVEVLRNWGATYTIKAM